MAVGLPALPAGPHITRILQVSLIAKCLRQVVSTVRSTACFHHLLDRFSLLLYVSPKRLSTQPPALNNLANMGRFGNLESDLAKSIAMRWCMTLSRLTS